MTCHQPIDLSFASKEYVPEVTFRDYSGEAQETHNMSELLETKEALSPGSKRALDDLYDSEENFEPENTFSDLQLRYIDAITSIEGMSLPGNHPIFVKMVREAENTESVCDEELFEQLDTLVDTIRSKFDYAEGLCEYEEQDEAYDAEIQEEVNGVYIEIKKLNDRVIKLTSDIPYLQGMKNIAIVMNELLCKSFYMKNRSVSIASKL